MPQDKVADFARLRPRELLEETERAIGDASLYRLHHELIEERKEFVSLELVQPANPPPLSSSSPSKERKVLLLLVLLMAFFLLQLPQCNRYKDSAKLSAVEVSSDRMTGSSLSDMACSSAHQIADSPSS